MLSASLPLVEVGAGGENLTLRRSELESCRPIRAQGGRRLRAFCPFHGSDHQRSLSVDLEASRFRCFACGAWGYLDWARERWRREGCDSRRKVSYQKANTEGVEPARADLVQILRAYQQALPGSIGEEYLRSRGIAL